MHFDLNILLLAITMVYGPVRLLALLKPFDFRLRGFLDSLIPFEVNNSFILWLDSFLFYVSLVFQAYFWISKIA